MTQERKGLSMAHFKLFVQIWVTCSLTFHCTARCLFGTYDDCAFKCHCTKVTDCNTQEVTCPGGCAPDILGYKWTGPACQIGNVAYHKQASVHGNVMYGSASKAVDGQLEPNCANINSYYGTTAQWSVDLGDQYRVINITIHFTKTSDTYYDSLRNHFTIRVSSSSPGPDTGVVCVVANGNTIPPITYTISCPDNTTGRYVYYSRLREGSYYYRAILCEVVVFGYKPVDCSRCPVGVTCSDVTGCKSCHGSYQPDCKQACDPGFYGTNCQEKCGNCADGTICNNTNGFCPSGCKKWWALDICRIYIEIPKPTNKTSAILTISRTSVDLEWVQITVNDDIVKYYGYEIRHKISSDNNFVNKVTSVPHRTRSTTIHATVTDLDGFTRYDFFVYPYREWNGSKDYGSPYDVVSGRTKCTDPEKPKVMSVLIAPVTGGSKDKVDVTFQDLESLYSGCDQLTDAWIQYKLEGRNKKQSIKLNLKSQTSSFEPQYGGTYLVWLTVENNDGLTSSSDVWSVKVKGPAVPAIILKKESTTSTVDIVIPVVASILYLMAIVIFVVYCIKCNK